MERKNYTHTYKTKITIFIPSLYGGGAEKAFLNIAKTLFQKKFNVNIVLFRFEGDYIELLPKEIKIFELFPKRKKIKKYIVTKLSNLVLPKILLKKFQYFLLYILGIITLNKKLRYLGKYNLLSLEFVKYIKKEKPNIILSVLIPANIISLLSKIHLGQFLRIIISERNTITSLLKNKTDRNIWLSLISELYPKSNGIIAVSYGVANDLLKILNGCEGKIKVIYNPVSIEEILEKSKEPINHPFFKEKVPVILSCGRLHPQKDFTTLIKAFSILCKNIDARLIILGKGSEKMKLKKLIRELGIEEKVDLPGFVLNPYPYMKNASVFVLSSIYEGLSNVIIEALACGCPVVSTDCPSGPREILENGKYGKLVPVKDYQKLAQAILDTINNPPNPQFLIKRAMDFSSDLIIQEYIKFINEILK